MAVWTIHAIREPRGPHCSSRCGHHIKDRTEWVEEDQLPRALRSQGKGAGIPGSQTDRLAKPSHISGL